MRIDFTKTILDFDGNAIEDRAAMATNGNTRVDLTLGRAASHALCAPFQDEANLSADDKFRRGMLAIRVRDDESAELRVEEIAEIKKVIAKMYGPLVVARAYLLLDPPPAEKAMPAAA